MDLDIKTLRHLCNSSRAEVYLVENCKTKEKMIQKKILKSAINVKSFVAEL